MMLPHTPPPHQGPDPHGAAQRSPRRAVWKVLCTTQAGLLAGGQTHSTGASPTWGPSEPPVTQLGEHLWAHLSAVSTPPAKTSRRDTPEEGVEVAWALRR